MKYLNLNPGTTAIGLALGPIVPDFIAANPQLVDYVEIPFEQLRHSPEAGDIQNEIPVILHCASMSVAGFVSPEHQTLDAIAREATRTKTPWIGEHLAFITANALESEGDNSKAPTTLSYTVCPQLSEETIERVAGNLNTLRSHFDVPLILENSPQYFAVPGSTMTMTEFIAATLERCEAGLLLDLTHFLISMLNTGQNAEKEIEHLPLESLVEVHISGLNVQSGVVWDDHATPATEPVFGLLDRVLKRTRPLAVTVEYNWSPSFPLATLARHIERVHEMVGH
jgi:uncharacterized protein (UPF0276 family)